MYDHFVEILFFSPSAVLLLLDLYPSAVRPLPLLNLSAIRQEV